MIAVYHNRIAQVKPCYEDEWILPGGGVEVKKNEDVEAAARRELKEECGVTGQKMILRGVYQQDRDGKHDYIILFETELDTSALSPSMEIRECGLFDTKALPSVYGGNLRRIQDWENRAFSCGKW